MLFYLLIEMGVSNMYVCGKRVCFEIINNNKKINKAYLSFGFDDKNIISYLQKNKINTKYLSISQLNKIAKEKHQGIILDIPEYQYFSFEQLLKEIANINNPFLIILDHLEDPHNLGAIIRTCEAAAVDGIIIPKDRSVKINETVMKVSVGAFNNVRICQVSNINEIIRKLKTNGFWVVGSGFDNSISYNKNEYNYPLVLILGNEGKGINKLTKELCDYTVNIPMYGKINSLNVSVAAGILIYKIVEKRGG